MPESASEKAANRSLASFSPEPWRYLGRIAPGGTLVDLASGGDGRVWAASPAGLFQETAAGWLPVVEGIPFARLSAVYAHRKTLVAAGMPVAIARSVDEGHTWNRSWAEQIHKPVTCFAASPNIAEDGVLLAGTDGDGVLRSTDRGHSWLLSNFGLHAFSVLSLAVAPEWGRREVAFAGTDRGVYESPNGGRAWRERWAGMPDDAVLSLAISPASDEHGVVWAGTEQHGLFWSSDLGRNWQPVEFGDFEAGPVNAILDLGGGLLLVGTGQSGVLRSEDGGVTWLPVTRGEAPVLSLLAGGDKIFAGLSEQGLLVSHDGGRNWRRVEDLAARRFSLLQPSASGWIAAGPQEGLWQSAGGQAWRSLPGTAATGPVLDVAAGGESLLFARPDGVWRIAKEGMDPEMVLKAPVARLVSGGTQVWAGTNDGRLYHSENSGCSWNPEQVPFDGQSVLAIDWAAGRQAGDELTVVTALPRRREMNLWRRTGSGWELLLTERTDWFTARLDAGEGQADRMVLGFGVTVLSLGLHGLRRAEITRPEAPVAAVLSVPGRAFQLAAAGERVFASPDSEHWEPFEEGLDGAAVTAFSYQAGAQTEESFLLALTSDGRLYRRPLSV